MSHEASRWAYRQNVPYKAKFVLITLADQADEVTGQVCYQRTDVKFFIAKLCMPERSFYRCVAALARQGYLTRKSQRGQQPEYCLRLDRYPTPIEDWSWGAEVEPEENSTTEDDVTEPTSSGSATLADRESDAEDCHRSHTALPLVAEQDSLDKPKYQRARAEKPLRGFSGGAQDVGHYRKPEIAATPARPADEMMWVSEGTRWWFDVRRYRKSLGMPNGGSHCGDGNNRGKTGRYYKRSELIAAGCIAGAGPPPAVDEAAAAEFAQHA